MSSLEDLDLLELLDPLEPLASLDRAHMDLLWDHLDLPDHLEHLDKPVVMANLVSLEHLASQEATRTTAHAHLEEVAAVEITALLALLLAVVPMLTTVAMPDTASE